MPMTTTGLRVFVRRFPRTSLYSPNHSSIDGSSSISSNSNITTMKHGLFVSSRQASSSRNAIVGGGDKNTNKTTRLLLYERGAERSTVPQAALALSSFNFLYWVWYCVDFIPAINESALEEMHVDPIFGYVGLAIGATIQTGSLMYPSNLVSKIEYGVDSSDNKRAEHNLNVYFHKLPWISPSLDQKTVYPLGSLTLDPSTGDAKSLLSKGDLFRGHVILRAAANTNTKTKTGSSTFGALFPLLVDFQQSEMKNSDMLLRVLMKPESAYSYYTATMATNSQKHEERRPRGLVVRKSKSGNKPKI